MLRVFLARGVNELTALRDGAFTEATGSGGTLIRSTVNGSSFEFSVGSMLSKTEIIQFAQLALDHKSAGFSAPLGRTTARFA